MRRGLLVVVILGALAVAGLWYGKTFAPCSPPMAALAGFGLKPAVACPAPAVDEAEAPRVVAPPAVTVTAAKTREFVDRLFVSGTLVAREEVQVSARDRRAEHRRNRRRGRRRGERRSGAGADRQHAAQCDARRERRRDLARRRGDRAGARHDRASAGAGDRRRGRLRTRAQARARHHVGLDGRTARDLGEDRSRATRRREERAERGPSRSKQPRRRAVGVVGANRAHRSDGAGVRDREPAHGPSRPDRRLLRRAAVPHHQGRRASTSKPKCPSSRWPGSS